MGPGAVVVTGLALTISMLVPLSPGVAATPAELDQLRTRITRLQDELGKSRDQATQWQRDVRRSEQRIARLAGEIRTLNRTLGETAQRIKLLENRRGELESNLVSQRAVLANQLRAAYALGRQQHLKLLLNQEDPAAVARVMTYFDYFNRARVERLQTLSADLETLAEVRQSLASEQAHRHDLRNRQATQQSEMKQSRQQRQQALSMLRARIATRDSELRGLKADEQRLVRVLRQLADALADIPAEASATPFPKLKGRLPWPSAGQLLARFGKPRQEEGLRWDGVLIGAVEGDGVHAISHGRVAYADWLRGFGLIVIIDHGDGFMSLYAHNQTLLRQVGDWVGPGDLVATVGNSGGQTRPALYFEIRKNGKPVDPGKWCRRAPAGRVGMNRVPESVILRRYPAA